MTLFFNCECGHSIDKHTEIGGCEYAEPGRWAECSCALVPSDIAETHVNAQLAAKDAVVETARKALQKIASRGVVFDAKGTWSQEVNQIASAALAALRTGEREG